MGSDKYTVSSAVRMVLAKVGKTATSIGKEWGVTRAAVTNKFYRDSWSAADLIRIARYSGAQMYFEFPDGQRIKIDSDNVE